MRRVGVGAKKPETELFILMKKIDELEKENKQLKAEIKKLEKESKADDKATETVEEPAGDE